LPFAENAKDLSLKFDFFYSRTGRYYIEEKGFHGGKYIDHFSGVETNMPMSSRENLLRTIEMRQPERIPCLAWSPQATWHKYREKLENVMIEYPSIFGDYQRGRHDFDDFGVQREGNSYTDEWGCVWYHLTNGLAGQVVGHPLEDWSTFDRYTPPNLLEVGGPPQCGGPPSETWDETRNRVKEQKKRGNPTYGMVPHDSLFLRVLDLRGFKNFLIDTVTQPQKLRKLIDMVVEHNMELIKRWLNIGVDVMYFGDDLGAQTGLMINPKEFRELFIPAYTKMFKVCRETGVHVYLHSDGRVIEVVEDLIKSGVTILNIQDRVNGIGNIARACKGKVCIDLDIDRQTLLPFGTPRDIESHVKEVVVKLGSKQGGLMLTAGLYPDVPLANIDALCRAMEKYGGGTSLFTDFFPSETTDR
jgi:uroporphyrinogen decarboxylase